MVEDIKVTFVSYQGNSAWESEREIERELTRLSWGYRLWREPRLRSRLVLRWQFLSRGRRLSRWSCGFLGLDLLLLSSNQKRRILSIIVKQIKWVECRHFFTPTAPKAIPGLIENSPKQTLNVTLCSSLAY